MPSEIFLMDPTLKPRVVNRFVRSQATAVPGTIKTHGTTLNIQLLASGKLSAKYVGNQDRKMKKQFEWQ